MNMTKLAGNVLVGVTALGFAAGKYIPGHDQSGPVLTAAVEFVAPKPAPAAAPAAGGVAEMTTSAVTTLGSLVKQLSQPKALESAFRGYFAFKSAHPDQVRKPYLYFVDYGLSSNTPRGYVFDMENLSIVDGPFMVAAGRGSAVNKNGVPVSFSNRSGSASTSLGLYVTGSTYAFSGHSAGHLYNSIGLRLLGQSDGFNDNAFARGVVAHGAPYVTPTRAGRSEGCPAMEQARAKELLPKLANGSVVFLFAPNDQWLSSDPWVNQG
jgi:hypothetical protein